MAAPLVVQAEIRKFDTTVEADPQFVHFSDGYLVAPGKVDITDLHFTAHDRMPSSPDDEGNVPGFNGDEEDEKTHDDGLRRELEDTSPEQGYVSLTDDVDPMP